MGYKQPNAQGSEGEQPFQDPISGAKRNFGTAGAGMAPPPAMPGVGAGTGVGVPPFMGMMPPGAIPGAIPGMPMVPQPPNPAFMGAQPPPPNEPPPKRQKVETSAEEWIASHPNPINIKVVVPVYENKNGWKLEGQTLEFNFKVSELVSTLKDAIAQYNLEDQVEIQLGVKERGKRKK